MSANGDFSPLHVRGSLAGISDAAALLELSTLLNSSLDLQFILSNVSLTAMGKLMVTRTVVLVATGKWTYRLRIAKGFASAPIDKEFQLAVDWQTPFAVDEIASSDAMVRDFRACCAACGIVFLVPVTLGNRMVGVIGLGPRMNRAPFDAEAVTFLRSIASIAATAVNSALTIDTIRDANRQLDARIQEMNTLFEISREINATFDEERILRVIGYALMGQMRVMRYAIFSFDGAAMRPVVVKLPAFAPRSGHQRSMRSMHEPLVLTEADAERRGMHGWLAGLGIRLVIPMMSQNQTRGALCLGERLGGGVYSHEETDYLSTLANITITALENARLVKETIEKEQLERELNLARTIQKNLLPKDIPQPHGYRIAAIHESSQLVGGDYYDVIPISDHEYVLAIGDVSGKGIPASLLMANVQAALRTIVPLRLPMPETTARLNALTFANTGAEKFITFFWGILDTRERTFTYINAGHNPPYLPSNRGTIRELGEGGLILGILDDVPPYDMERVAMRRGDVIFMYTDGVNEAMSKQQEVFGDDRLMALLMKHASLEPRKLIESVKREIVTHTRGARQSDDITMLVVQCVEEVDS
jgi:phosphoserine phosphatase RsbU/P